MNVPVVSLWPRTARVLSRAVDTALALFLLASIFHFPEQANVDLDSSWRITLTRAVFSGKQFGRDIVFTYGPLGFLLSNTYEGTNFAALLFWQGVKSLGFTAVILSVAGKLPTLARWTALIFLALFVTYFEDTFCLLVILIMAMRCLEKDPPGGLWWCVAAGLVLAFLSALKFTLLLFSTASVIVVMAATLSASRRLAFTFGAAFVGGFLGIWKLAGQHLLTLPDYLLNSREIAKGYAFAMGLEPPPVALGKALAVLFLLALYLGLVLFRKRLPPRLLASVMLVALYAFLVWKHGFIRADGHMGYFFTAMIGLVALVSAILPRSACRPAVEFGTLVGCGLLAVWGLDDSYSITRASVLSISQRQLSDKIGALKHWKDFRASYDQRLLDELASCPLLQTKAIIGRDTVDVLGYQGGIVYLHGLNYQPRPIFQSYSVYTPDLAKRNEEFFLSDRAPVYFLQRLQTIDGRLVSMDDARILCQLPIRYEFVHQEDGYLLWRRKPGVGEERFLSPHPLAVGKKGMDDPLKVGGLSSHPLWLRLNLKLSWLGRVRSFLYQVPLVQLRVTDGDSRTWLYRLPISQAPDGFIVSPLIGDAVDYLMFVHQLASRTVNTISLEIAPADRKYFAVEYDYSLTEIYLPPSSWALGWNINRVRYSLLEVAPEVVQSFAPPGEAEIDGHPVIVFHAPSTLRFDLPMSARRVSGNFGFVRGAYTDGGNTLGASYRVIWSDGTKHSVLFSRTLDPVHRQPDRGLQTFSVDLPNMPGGKLILEIVPGPAGDNSWCWTAWTKIKIQP